MRGQNATKSEFRLMGWGLIPSWAKDPLIGAKLINARSATVTEKPSFRAVFKYRRCLIPADGFCEWQKTQGGANQPFNFSMAGNAVFAFAGLWESWNDIETCTMKSRIKYNIFRKNKTFLLELDSISDAE